MVAQRESPPAPETQDSPTEAAPASPDAPTPPVESDEPGQISDPAQAAAETGESPPEGDVETPEAAADENEESSVPADPKHKNGAQARIDRLTAEKTSLVTALAEAQARITDLESTVASAPAPGVRQPFPETVAKLKTVEAVQTRLSAVETDVEALSDFLDTNPGDADTAYTIGEQQFTRKQLVERRAQLRIEAKALPQRAQEIANAAQLSTAQASARKQVLADYPWLADSEHPDTKAVQEVIKAMPAFKQTPSPEYWAAVVVKGQQALNAELEARKGKKTVGLARPAGKVPLGKPHTAANGAGGRINGNGDVKTLLERHGSERSAGSFAALLSATGR